MSTRASVTVLAAALSVNACKDDGGSKADGDGADGQKEVTVDDDTPVACGRLSSTDDPDEVLLALDDHAGKTPAIEVLDPLSVESAAFEQRYAASRQAEQLHRQALLLPLDTSCNWMLSESANPGACAISEAVLCAARHGKAGEVVTWAFEHREELVTASEANPNAAKDRVRARFGDLADCVGSPEAKALVNKALRWAVKRELPVTVPQLYVDGTQLCDPGRVELDGALSKLLAR